MQHRPGLVWVLTIAATASACSSSSGDGGMMSGNSAPTARIDASRRQIPVNDNNTTVVRLDGNGSFDPDGDLLSYSWQVPGGTFVEGTGPNDPAIAVTFPGVAPYTVTLTVDDRNGETDAESVDIVPGNPGNPGYP